MSDVLPTSVYLLSFAASAACAWLLARANRRSPARLLFWSAACFTLLALNNLAVIFDLLMFPQFDFRLIRHGLAIAAVSVLLFGFIWDLDE